MIVARCKWCGEEMNLPPGDDGHVHLGDIKDLADAHYGGVMHAEMFLFCTTCWKADPGHRPCFDTDCWCECSA